MGKFLHIPKCPSTYLDQPHFCALFSQFYINLNFFLFSYLYFFTIITDTIQCRIERNQRWSFFFYWGPSIKKNKPKYKHYLTNNWCFFFFKYCTERFVDIEGFVMEKILQAVISLQLLCQSECGPQLLKKKNCTKKMRETTKPWKMNRVITRITVEKKKTLWSLLNKHARSSTSPLWWMFPLNFQ